MREGVSIGLRCSEVIGNLRRIRLRWGICNIVERVRGNASVHFNFLLMCADRHLSQIGHQGGVGRSSMSGNASSNASQLFKSATNPIFRMGSVIKQAASWLVVDSLSVNSASAHLSD